MGIKLVKKIFITGTIETKTGLSVGGSSVGLEIGGADKVVLRNPLTNQPYIPGSSLKGKMRSLTEKMDGHMSITVKAIKKDKEGKEKVVREETYNRSSEIYPQKSTLVIWKRKKVKKRFEFQLCLVSVGTASFVQYLAYLQKKKKAKLQGSLFVTLILSELWKTTKWKKGKVLLENC